MGQFILSLLFLTTVLSAALGQPDIRTTRIPLTDSVVFRMHDQIRRLIQNGNLEEAEIQLRAGPDGLDSTVTIIERAVVNTSFGALYLSKGRNDRAVEYLQRAVNLWDEAGKLQSLAGAETLAYMGNLYRASGKYQQAEEILGLVLLTRQKLLPSRHGLIAAALNDLGLVFSTSDPDRALTYYQQALDIYNADPGNRERIAIAKTNMAFLYGQQDRYEDAVTNLEAALSLWHALFSGPHAGKAFVLFRLGTMSEKMVNPGSAEEFYTKSLAEYLELYGPKHPDVARAYNALGNLQKANGNFERALVYYQKAIVANHPEFNSENLMKTPPARAFYDGTVLLYSLMYKAEALEERYLRHSLRIKDLRLALHTLQSCDSLIYIIRNQITSESDKLTLGAVASDVYSDGVRISMLVAQEAFTKTPWYELAFFFSERNKAAVLLGALSDANAKAFSGIPASVLEEERELKAEMALYIQKLSRKPGDWQERYLRQAFYDLSRAHRAFIDTLESNYPEYFNLKYSVPPPSIAALRQKLADSTMVISYFIDEKKAMLYIFTITPEKYSVEERSLPREFDRYITGLRNSIYYSEASVFAGTSARLSKLLLPHRIPDAVKDLVIIPTSRLNTIPFETLIMSTPAGFDFQDFDYLIRRFSLRYEFSGGLIAQKRQKTQPRSPSILLCAPVLFQGRDMPDLPETANEVREIAAAFRSRNLFSKELMYGSAFKENLQQAGLSRYTYLHFATHGLMDETNPDLSGFLLASNAGSDDGILSASEIYNLNLDSELVTLSACETGLGKISKGEGVIGLSRALIYAGARGCMVSLWKVADDATAQLMTRYYATLIDSPKRNLSATLQHTKRRMITDGKHGAPYYWASFVLIGY